MICLTMLATALSVVPADRTAVHDGKGVLRWADDGSEVAVFGVNYYTPFNYEYVGTAKRGLDHKEVIRRDVAQLRRLGLSLVRVHCFDREVSDREGHLLDNHHMELLDYLIAECASNGMWTVLTPIAWWGLTEGDATNGFSFATTRERLASEPELIAIQQRYEEAFARHVNRYTGRRYADDPAVLSFELINEPKYPKGFTSEQIADYANALLDGLRASGTTKPVFYNSCWDGKKLSVVPNLRTDGVTGEDYCCGLRSGNAFEDLQLSKVRKVNMDLRFEGKARGIYEFDASDTPGAYMYPAMAWLFRSEGIQFAAQFQYETTPLASENLCYKTHFLNLVYTPEKALSTAIAAEVFRHFPRGTPFSPDSNEMVFPPFRVNAESNLSEMVTATDYLYTATPITPPPSPKTLQRVWGCGSSSVVSSDGTGAYFFDRIAEGVWRLQVYPNILPIADPYTGLPGPKVVVLAGSPNLTVRLPDLGDEFAVWRTADGERNGQARKGKFSVEPGDYVLTRSDRSSPSEVSVGRAADMPAYWAPAPDPVDPSWRRWPPTRAELLESARLRATKPTEWNFLDVQKAACAGGRLMSGADGQKAVRYSVRSFVTDHSVRAKVSAEGWVYRELFPEADGGTALLITGRAMLESPEVIELALTLEDGQTWGTNVTLPPTQGVVRVPFKDLKYFGHWSDVPKFQEGFRPDIRRLKAICISSGSWLYPTTADMPHSFEISRLTVE